MGELVNFTFTNHKNLLYEGLWKCFQSNFDTNFVLSGNSEGTCIKIHALVFAIFCPMKYLKVKLNNEDTFNLSSCGADLDEEDVKTLVEFIYRGNVGIKKEKLSVVKSGAQVLGLIDLVNQIENYQKTRERLSETTGSSCAGINQHDEVDLSSKTNDVLILEKVPLDAGRNSQDETSKDQASNDQGKECKLTRRSLKSEDDNLIVAEKGVVEHLNPRSRRIIILSPLNKSNNSDNKITTRSSGIIQQHRDYHPQKISMLIVEKAALDKVEKSENEASKDRDSKDQEKETEITQTTSKSEDVNLIVEEKPVVKKGNPRAKRFITVPSKSDIPDNQKKPRAKRFITVSSKSDNSDNQKKPKLTIKWVSKLECKKSAEGRAADYFDPIRKTYLCKHCGKALKDARHFEMHLSCHENPSLKHRCQLCDYETSCKNKLKSHMTVKHHLDKDGNKLEKNIKCPDCSFTCVAMFQLNNHRLKRHAKRHECDVCGYRCGSPAELKRHVQGRHQKERNYLCDSCGYKAKTMQVLKNHVKTHEGKKMVCSYCGQSLSVNSFAKHLQLHTSDVKPHACHLCKFASRKKYSLKVHLKNVHKIEQEQVENNYWLEAGL